jgi:hypothetical protein
MKLQKIGLVVMANKSICLNTQLYPLPYIHRAVAAYSAIATLRVQMLDELHIKIEFAYENEKLNIIDYEFCNYVLSLIATDHRNNT